MATINPIIVPAKILKSGKHKIRISVAHNGETRYIVTDIIIDSANEFKNGQVVKRPDAASKNTKIRSLLQGYQNSIDELDYTDGLTCSELIYYIVNAKKRKHRTISSIYEEFIGYANIKPGTIICYNTCYKSLISYTGPNMQIEHITHITILGYDKYLRKRKISQTTIKNRMSFVAALINFAKRCHYAEFKINPFDGYKLPEATVRQAWLSVDEVKSIRDLQLNKKKLIKCRDLFMLSYYLGGINMCDLLKINFNTSSESICYIRTKTENKSKLNKYVAFDIPEEAKEIILKYKGKNGFLKVTDRQKKDSMRGFFNYHMNQISSLTGIKNLIYYSARKSFSQHAFVLGVNTGIIDYILGHRLDKAGTCLYNYISVTPELASNAIRKVLDNLK